MNLIRYSTKDTELSSHDLGDTFKQEAIVARKKEISRIEKQTIKDFKKTFGKKFKIDDIYCVDVVNVMRDEGIRNYRNSGLIESEGVKFLYFNSITWYIALECPECGECYVTEIEDAADVGKLVLNKAILLSKDWDHDKGCINRESRKEEDLREDDVEDSNVEE